MTVSQKVQIVTFDYGSSLSDVTLRNLLTDALITGGTADTCDEISADAGVYIADFVNVNSSALIPAGIYRLRTIVNGAPINRYITLAGTDGEVVQSTSVPPDVTVFDYLESFNEVLVEPISELSSPPAANSSLKNKITWIFQWLRNKSTQTATQRKLYADDGTTVISTETVSDDGTTYTKGEQS